MKTSVIFNFVLAIAVVVLGVRLLTNGGNSSSAEEAVLDNIATRTSIRDYQDKAVEADKVDKLLRAGMAAPSAVNKQPWHFIVVDDRATLDKLGDALPNASMVKKAPLAIVVCGDLDKALEGDTQEYWIQDASAATENILLAAHGMGLGAVWTGLYPPKDRSMVAAEILGTPESIVPLDMIVVGYPGESPLPKDKYREDNISHNAYGVAYGSGSTGNADEENKPEEGLKPFDVTKDLKVNPFEFFRGDGLLLAAGDKTSSNAMTIGWGGLGTLWRKSVVSVYVHESRYTYKFMEKSKYFTVMSFKDKKVLEYMGSNSGRDGDKAKALGLHTLYTENGTPYYAEADMVIECRIMSDHLFSQSDFKDDVPRNMYSDGFPDGGYHAEYIGEVVSALKR